MAFALPLLPIKLLDLFVVLSIISSTLIFVKSLYIKISNFIIKKASIKAFELEEELGLPIHIKLPTLNIKE